MAFVVEDGTGLATANSYAAVADMDAYFLDRGYTVVAGDEEAALVRATQDLDALYAGRFSGTPLKGRDQALEWPRTGATDVDGNAIATDEIPIEVIQATFEFALRELATPGSVLPDLERGGSIRSIKAGSVAIEYGANASSTTTLQLINGIMSSLVGGSIRPSMVGTSSRG